jgi:uncharacterized protein
MASLKIKWTNTHFFLFARPGLLGHNGPWEDYNCVPGTKAFMKRQTPDQADPPKPAARKSPKPRAVAAATTRKTVAKAPAAKARRAPKSTRLKIPPILLEGDASAAPAAGGPGQRYALGPTPPGQHFPPGGSELPESYGTQQLFLTARDPHWLYAHWDLTRAQLKQYNSLSADGHLVLRVFRGALESKPLSEIHVHPESRNWFVPVPDAGAKYLGALGYFDSARRWVTLACSGATLTPPDSLSDETTLRFATIPHDVPFEQLLSIVKLALREHVPLVEAIQQLRAQGYKGLPAPEEIRREWTPAQEQALAEIVSMDHVRRIWVGSLEITELVRRQLQHDLSSMSAGQFGLTSSWSGAVSSFSSPFGGVQRQRGFWFNVNAELIIYGATEPDARVTIGDRTIKLRPDGTFSFRFALPDGQYPLPAAAHSADGVETREAHLKFSRSTAYQGDVGAHPQDKRLKPPVVDAVA